ncbi:MAG TPA: helix-turn-helix domain-containing protein [Candidatus Tectomicrobia bacterium]
MLTNLRQSRQVYSVAGRRGGRKVREAEEWVWVFQEHLRGLAMDRRLAGSHWRVLAYVASYATFAQDMTLKQKDIAAALGIAFQTVSRVLKELGAIGILTRVSAHEIPATYRVNSLYIYKGHRDKLAQRRAHQYKERVHATAPTSAGVP